LPLQNLVDDHDQDRHGGLPLQAKTDPTRSARNTLDPGTEARRCDIIQACSAVDGDHPCAARHS
jgi:hypothetical protein